MNIKKTPHYKKGLSIIETVVAVLILSFVIGAPIGVLYHGLRFSQSAKERVEARFLAEEPIEYIRNLKDSNIVTAINQIKNGDPVTVAFDDGISCQTGMNCFVDVHNNTLGVCGAGGGTPSCVVRYIASSECQEEDLEGCFKLYGHGGSYTSDTIYTRTVEIDKSSSDELHIVVKVTWQDRQGNDQTMQVDEFFRSFGIE